jgi:Skp family chaperone for outer membrane proteins
MKKVFFSLLVVVAVLFGVKASAQVKVAVFDIDYMVQAMPGYARVDSLVQLYQRDSLGTEYQILNSEYHRLDSTRKADSAAGKPKAVQDYTNNQLQQVGYKLVYWQQYAQQKSQQKTGELAQPLYQQVVEAYKKVLATKKYTIILKPQTYEAGFPIDNLFVSVAKELNLTELPQELLVLGDNPDAKPGATGTGAGNSGATNKPATGAPTGTSTKPKQ